MAAPTVLLVDDDPLVREMFAEALRAAGYRVVEAANGRDALTELGRSPVDLIVTDLFMPEVDGLELLRALRRQGSTTPVVAISAGGALKQTQLLHLARVLGARRILEKPVDMVELVETARALAPPGAPAEPAGERPGPAALRILVADDEPAVLALVEEILQRDGHRVDVALDGAAALELVERHPYDVVVTDLRMPGLDGVGLYREIARRHPALARRIVFLTAATLDQAVMAFLQGTGALVVEKPFAPDVLQRAVREAAAG